VAAVAIAFGACRSPKPVAVRAPAVATTLSGEEKLIGEDALQFKLDNGLEVVLQENRAAPVVAFQAWVRAGAADEPPRLAGVSHFLEHMLFKGTARRGVGDIAREVESAGGEINAWTSYDETVYHLVLGSAFFETGLDVLADALIHSAFDAEELERERGVILEELNQGQDDPDRMASEALFAATFGKHPYARPIIGSAKTVKALRRADLVAYHAQKYVGSLMTLVVVGDFDANVARRQIEAAFADLPHGAASSEGERSAPSKLRKIRQRVLVKDVKESQIMFGFQVPSVRHEDIPALDLLSIVLGQGESSRLNREVVRNQQRAKSAYSYLFAARDAGILVVAAAPGSTRVEQTSRAVFSEVLDLRQRPIKPDEFARARVILESERVFDRETVQGYARKLGYFAAIAGDVGYEDRYMERLGELTPRDLQEVASRYLSPSALAVVVQVPQGARKTGKASLDSKKSAVEGRVSAALAGAQKRRSASVRTARSGPEIEPRATGKVVVRTLPQGIRVLVLPDPLVPIVAVRALWKGGVQLERPATNGVSNLIASLLTRGTRTRSATEISAQVEGMAGLLAGYSGRNSLGVQGEFLARHWETGLELIVDCLVNPIFPEAELDKERRIILDDIRSQDDNLAHSVFRLFHNALWTRHPYRLDPLGTADSIGGLSRRRLLTHYRRHYAPEGLTIAVVGDVEPEPVLENLAGLFPQKSDGSRDTADQIERPRPKLAKPGQSFEFRHREQAHVVLGFPGTTIDDPDKHGLEVLAQILSGQGGRLFGELREKRGLVYRVTAFSLEGVDPGYFAVYLAASPGNLEAAVQTARNVLAEVISSGVSVEEVERAQRYLVGSYSVGLQRKSSVAAALAIHETYGAGWQDYKAYPKMISAVTARQVQQLARKYLSAEKEVMAVVKPPEETPRAATQAARSPRGRSSSGRPGEKLKR